MGNRIPERKVLRITDIMCGISGEICSSGLDHNYYLTDEQGSVRYVLDADGHVQNDYRYDAFGQRIAGQENIPNRLRYNAQIEDDLTGLYNLRAYCSSNPVMYADPSGYSAWDDLFESYYRNPDNYHAEDCHGNRSDNQKNKNKCQKKG